MIAHFWHTVTNQTGLRNSFHYNHNESVGMGFYKSSQTADSLKAFHFVQYIDLYQINQVGKLISFRNCVWDKKGPFTLALENILWKEKLSS